MGGHWTDIESASFRAYELNQMETLVSIATSHGAHLDLLTMPCMDSGFAEGDPPGPSDSQQRRALYNGMLRQVAAEHPSSVSVVDYGSVMCTTGTFAQFLNGVQVRTPDGVHTPAYLPGNIFGNNSPEAVANAFDSWLSPRLWPLLLDTLRPAAANPPEPLSSRPATNALAAAG